MRGEQPGCSLFLDLSGVFSVKSATVKRYTSFHCARPVESLHKLILPAMHVADAHLDNSIIDDNSVEMPSQVVHNY